MGKGQTNEWEASIYSVLLGSNNTHVIIQAPKVFSEPQDLIVSISFRYAQSMAIVLRKEQQVRTDGSQLLIYDFNLPPGKYQAFIDISSPSLPHYSIALPYTLTLAPGALAVSDIFFSYESPPTSIPRKPILTGRLDPSLKYCSFYLEIYSPKVRPLTARAVLYREKEKGASSKSYTSLQQVNRVLGRGGDKMIFNGQLEIGILSEGTYLLELLIYEDDLLLIEKSAYFVVDWQSKTEIFNKLDRSIEMLQYMTSFSVIERLKKIEDGAQQREAFLQVWSDRYGAAAEEQMIRYYKKLFEANRRFGKEGWYSDRGRIFIEYGEPDKQKQVRTAKNTRIYWEYSDWNLSFWFENGCLVPTR